MMRTLKHTNSTIEKKIVFSLGISLVVLFVVYGYLVNATIINIVERKALERDAGDLVAMITDLEIENGELRKYITYEYAYSIGYVQPKGKTFASAKQLVGNISIGF